MAEEKKLETVEKSTNNVKEPSYEELKNYCNQLMMQRNQIAQRLQQVSDVINKMPWLFEVVKNKESFSKPFVNNCIQEIEEIMTPPVEEPEGKKEEE